MTLRLVTAACIALIAIPTAGCSSPSNAGCDPVPSSEAASLANGINAVDIDKAAEFSADGGTYVVASVPGKDAVLTWFRTSAGATFTVGEVTAMFSKFPDSAQFTKAGVGAPGFNDAKSCVS